MPAGAGNATATVDPAAGAAGNAIDCVTTDAAGALGAVTPPTLPPPQAAKLHAAAIAAHQALIQRMAQD
jgi:hypothetical protein